MSKVARVVKDDAVGTAPLFEKCHRYEEAARVRQTGYYSFFRVIESAQDPEVVHAGRRLVRLVTRGDVEDRLDAVMSSARFPVKPGVKR